MPTLGAPLDFAKLEGRNFRGHLLGTAPAAPVTGQLYFNTGDNTLYWYDGTAWVSARGGVAAVPDASPSVKGIVQLAGDLAGTAASPQIAAGVITDAEVAVANKDGIASTPSLRTLGVGSQQASPGNRTLDGIPLAAADVNLNSKKITALADPANPQDAATKVYVDSVAQGLDAKASCKAASIGANVSLTSAPATLDGASLSFQTRVLLKDQTLPQENGIYVFTAAGSPLTRASDLDIWNEVPGAYVWVEQGTVNGDTGWVSTADMGVGIINTTPMPWTQFAGAGEYTGGAGLTLTGKTFDVGAGPGITVNPDTVQVANNGITNAMIADGAVNLASADVTGILQIDKGGTQYDTSNATGKFNWRALFEVPHYYSTATHGAGTTISIPQNTHGGRISRGIVVQVQDEATGNVELPDISVAATGDVTITYAVSVAANSKRITILG